MENHIFPQVAEVLVRQERASYEKKCIFHERLLFHYLIRKIEGWSVKNFLDEENIKRYALYAVTDFTDLFLKDLKTNNGNNPQIICDKNAEKFRCGFMGFEVLSLEKMIYMYKSKEIQKIIVMSILHENEIIEELLKRGIWLHDMISIISVLYS